MSENLRPILSSLTLAQAAAVIEAALAAGHAHQLLPVAVVVLDAGSQLVAYQRQDGCANLRFEIARGKAANMGPDIAWFTDPAGNILSVLSN